MDWFQLIPIEPDGNCLFTAYTVGKHLAINPRSVISKEVKASLGAKARSRYLIALAVSGLVPRASATCVPERINYGAVECHLYLLGGVYCGWLFGQASSNIKLNTIGTWYP
jgi:hypothetical protein